MIGKAVFRTGFLDCLNYVFSKDGFRLLASNMLNAIPLNLTQPLNLAHEFQAIANRSWRIEKPCFHLSLSPHPNDSPQLTDADKTQFVSWLLDKIGMSNCQWVLVEHNDTITTDGQPRPHLHAIINRIPLDDNKAVPSSFLFRKIERALQELRQDFNLTPVTASWEVAHKAPSTGQIRRYRSQQQEYTNGQRTVTPLPPCPSKSFLQQTLADTIEHISKTSKRFSDLIQQLVQQNIDIKIKWNPDKNDKEVITKDKSGQSIIPTNDKTKVQGIFEMNHLDKKDASELSSIQGLSYRIQDFSIRASQLGKLFTLNGLREKGIIIDVDNEIQFNLLTQLNQLAQINHYNQDNALNKLSESSLFNQSIELDKFNYFGQLNELSPSARLNQIIELVNVEESTQLDELPQSEQLNYIIELADVHSQEDKIYKSEQKYNLDWQSNQAEETSNNFAKNLSIFHIIQQYKDKNTKNKLKDKMLNQYGIPEEFTENLYEHNLLDINEQDNPLWIKQALIGSTNPLFWLTTTQPEQAKRAIITDAPIEAISAFLIDFTNQCNQSSIYLSIDSVQELPTQFLNQIDEVIINCSDQTLTDSIKAQFKEVQIIPKSFQKEWQTIWESINSSSLVSP